MLRLNRMAVPPPLDSGERVARYVGSLRARAASFQALRALCACVGASSSAFVLAALLVGPVVTPGVSRALLAALALLALAVLAAGLWPLRRLRGSGGSALLAVHEPALASRVRSALELREQQAVPGSQALVSAHADAVYSAVRALPASEVVPWRWLLHASVVLGLLLTAACAILLGSHEGLRVGAAALLRPAELRADGLRVARVVASTSARLVFPSYLGKAPATVRNASVIDAPRGTTIELTIMPRMPAQQGLLLLGSAPTRLRGAPGGALFGRFVVRDDAPLALRVFDDGQWYEDAIARKVHAIEDKRPIAELIDPATPTVELHERIPLRLRASDDHGLTSVELAVRIGERDETRTRLWSSVDAKQPQTSLQDEAPIVPAALGAQPGDSIVVWLEARDGDTVSGPNVGVSKAIAFEVATDAQQLSLRLPRLREVLDGSLEALGDRLEVALPDTVALAAQRTVELHTSYEPWISDLDALISSSRQKPDALDIDQLEGVLDRMRRELGREAALGHGGGRALRAFQDADARVLNEHERDVLLLADMLAQGLVDEARALAQELSGLKDHLRELLQQLKKNPSPEAERALLSEIAKAQRRLRELAQSLARLSNRVPSEFINREALPQSEARDALEDLRSAIEKGDMSSAEAQLAALEHEIDSLNENLEHGGARFREAHYGAQDRALAQARDQLGELSAEQARLSERTRELVKRAADQLGKQGASQQHPELEQRAEGLQRDIEALQSSSPTSPESPWLERAQTRMRDAADALRTGDVAEARRMAQSAQSNLEQAASSLDQDSRMFPGPHGETWERARAAAQAASSLQQLQQQLDRAMPDLGSAMGEAERNQLRGDAKPQRGARERAEALQSQLGGDPSGEDQGRPLSPQGEHGLEQAADAMRRAERALDRGDGQQAALEQEDANERLHQVSEQLARKNQRGQQGREQGNRDSGQREGGDGGDVNPEGPVRIPGADEFSGPVQMRRKLLDAMREQAPNDFEGAVQRYYRELLR
jgi:hypothetical protein